MKTMESIYKAYNGKFLVGNVYGRKTEEIHKKLIKQHFNALTPENYGKWSAIQPKEGRFTFSKMDELMDFAEQNQIEVIGHTLVWGNQTPKWVFQDKNGNQISKDLLVDRMKTHIEKNMLRYKGRIQYWDLVNEAFNGDGSYKNNDWYKIIGPEYLEIAFAYASSIDPEAKLLYNDYGMTKSGRVNAVVEMVENLRSKNIPIHGIGIQGHWMLDHPAMYEIQSTLDTFKELEIPVHITELDISVLPSPYRGANITKNFKNSKELDPYTKMLPSEVEQNLALRYESVFKLFLKYDNIKRVSFWGVSDADSWKNNHPVQGRTDYTLLFDRSMKKKSAFHSVLSLGDDGYLTEIATPVNSEFNSSLSNVVSVPDPYNEEVSSNSIEPKNKIIDQKVIVQRETKQSPVTNTSLNNKKLKWNAIDWTKVDLKSFDWPNFLTHNKIEIVLLLSIIGTLLVTFIAIFAKLRN